MKNDFFDRFMDRFLKKDPQKRVRQVILSALILLLLCLAGVGGFLYYASEYRVPGKNESLLKMLTHPRSSGAR